jgi:hypothetical protein
MAWCYCAGLLEFFLGFRQKGRKRPACILKQLTFWRFSRCFNHNSFAQVNSFVTASTMTIYTARDIPGFDVEAFPEKLKRGDFKNFCFPKKDHGAIVKVIKEKEENLKKNKANKGAVMDAMKCYEALLDERGVYGDAREKLRDKIRHFARTCRVVRVTRVTSCEANAGDTLPPLPLLATSLSSEEKTELLRLLGNDGWLLINTKDSLIYSYEENFPELFNFFFDMAQHKNVKLLEDHRVGVKPGSKIVPTNLNSLLKGLVKLMKECGVTVHLPVLQCVIAGAPPDRAQWKVDAGLVEPSESPSPPVETPLHLTRQSHEQREESDSEMMTRRLLLQYAVNNQEIDREVLRQNAVMLDDQGRIINVQGRIIEDQGRILEGQVRIAEQNDRIIQNGQDRERALLASLTPRHLHSARAPQRQENLSGSALTPQRLEQQFNAAESLLLDAEDIPASPPVIWVDASEDMLPDEPTPVAILAAASPPKSGDKVVSILLHTMNSLSLFLTCPCLLAFLASPLGRCHSGSHGSVEPDNRLSVYRKHHSPHHEFTLLLIFLTHPCYWALLVDTGTQQPAV